MLSKQTVAIVDAYAPSRRLAPAFMAAGYSCVRVQSTPSVPRLYQVPFPREDYVADIIHQGSLDETLQKLKQFAPVAVLAGGEIGVEFADLLSERLGLPSNGTSLSAARRDKYTMIETVGRAGLGVARQTRVTSAEQLRQWYGQAGGRIVLKPARGAGSEGVRFCDSADEAVAGYQQILGATNLFSEQNLSVVAQEYLTGTEYIINTVSSAGQHHVCDMWRTTRLSANGVADILGGLYIMPAAGDVQDQLRRYSFGVLDAVGIAWGPAHVEVRMTPAGPRLIEVGARIGGGDNPYYAAVATGESQLNWTVDAYVRPERFKERADRPYQVRNFFCSAPMLSPFEGTLKSYPHLATVEKLPSVHDIRIAVHPGERIVRSVDDLTYPLIVNLSHPVEEVVMTDLGTLRYLDGHGFYEVA